MKINWLSKAFNIGQSEQASGAKKVVAERNPKLNEVKNAPQNGVSGNTGPHGFSLNQINDGIENQPNFTAKGQFAPDGPYDSTHVNRTDPAPDKGIGAVVRRALQALKVKTLALFGLRPEFAGHPHGRTLSRLVDGKLLREDALEILDRIATGQRGYALNDKQLHALANSRRVSNIVYWFGQKISGMLHEATRAQEANKDLHSLFTKTRDVWDTMQSAARWNDDLCNNYNELLNLVKPEFGDVSSGRSTTPQRASVFYHLEIEGAPIE